MLKTSLAGLILCFTATAASADEPSVAITVSPIHLFVPMGELTIEGRVGDRIGIALIAGVGAYRDPDTNQRISLFEGGASARYYVTGSFRGGLQLGAEAAYVYGATDAMNIDVKAAGLGLSPFAGYKWTHSSGFTFEGQLGATFMVAKAKAESGQMAEDRGIGPMLNLNVGYSF
ncbi:MAG: hypothetical protein HOV81_29865 [Kofleriaceae bacterium]|nr:hypothetical protein [Kofleriaceae bacterium]